MVVCSVISIQKPLDTLHINYPFYPLQGLLTDIAKVRDELKDF